MINPTSASSSLQKFTVTDSSQQTIENTPAAEDSLRMG